MSFACRGVGQGQFLISTTGQNRGVRSAIRFGQWRWFRTSGNLVPSIRAGIDRHESNVQRDPGYFCHFSSAVPWILRPPDTGKERRDQQVHG
jgi:hypothetical protein